MGFEVHEAVLDLVPVSIDYSVEELGLLAELLVAFARDGHAGGTVFLQSLAEKKTVEAFVPTKWMSLKLGGKVSTGGKLVIDGTTRISGTWPVDLGIFSGSNGWNAFKFDGSSGYSFPSAPPKSPLW